MTGSGQEGENLPGIDDLQPQLGMAPPMGPASFLGDDHPVDFPEGSAQGLQFTIDKDQQASGGFRSQVTLCLMRIALCYRASNDA